MDNEIGVKKKLVDSLLESLSSQETKGLKKRKITKKKQQQIKNKENIKILIDY